MVRNLVGIESIRLLQSGIYELDESPAFILSSKAHNSDYKSLSYLV